MKADDKARILTALQNNNRVCIKKELAMEANLEHLAINNLISK